MPSSTVTSHALDQPNYSQRDVQASTSSSVSERNKATPSKTGKKRKNNFFDLDPIFDKIPSGSSEDGDNRCTPEKEKAKDKKK